MSIHSPEPETEPSGRHPEQYPAEKAFGPRQDRPAWQRVDPDDLSGGYVEVHIALDCQDPSRSHEEVTTT